MGIDFETDGFFGEMASMRMDLETYKEWCHAYESFNYPKWTMKDGNKIALGDMTKSHINNSISMLNKKDPTNGWIDIFKQEKKYRSLKDKIITLQIDLEKMEEIMDIGSKKDIFCEEVADLAKSIGIENYILIIK